MLEELNRGDRSFTCIPIPESAVLFIYSHYCLRSHDYLLTIWSCFAVPQWYFHIYTYMYTSNDIFIYVWYRPPNPFPSVVKEQIQITKLSHVGFFKTLSTQPVLPQEQWARLWEYQLSRTYLIQAKPLPAISLPPWWCSLQVMVA